MYNNVIQFKMNILINQLIAELNEFQSIMLKWCINYIDWLHGLHCMDWLHGLHCIALITITWFNVNVNVNINVNVQCSGALECQCSGALECQCQYQCQFKSISPFISFHFNPSIQSVHSFGLVWFGLVSFDFGFIQLKSHHITWNQIKSIEIKSIRSRSNPSDRDQKSLTSNQSKSSWIIKNWMQWIELNEMNWIELNVDLIELN
jgi:hypothetical protein